MKQYRVEVDLSLTLVVIVEAASEDEAIEMVEQFSGGDLLHQGEIQTERSEVIEAIEA